MKLNFDPESKERSLESNMEVTSVTQAMDSLALGVTTSASEEGVATRPGVEQASKLKERVKAET